MSASRDDVSSQLILRSVAPSGEHLQQYYDAFLKLDQAFSLCELLYDADGQPNDYVIIETNPACEAITGFAPEQVRGQRARALIPALDQIWIDKFAAVVRTGQPQRFEHYVARTQKWFTTYAISLGGNCFGALVRDITARKTTEGLLRESEARYRALAHATADTLFRLSADGAELHEIFGGSFYPAGMELDRNASSLTQFVHPDDRDAIIAVITESMAMGKGYEVEHRALRSDGSWGWALTRAVPVYDAEGEIVEWVGSATDITDRKQAERHNLSLGAFAGKLAAALTTAQVAELMTAAVVQLIPLTWSNVYRVSEDGTELVCLSEITEPAFKDYARLRLESGSVIAQAFREQRSVYIESQDMLLQRYPHLADRFVKANITGLGCFPFFGRNGKVSGALYVVMTEAPRRLSLAERNLLFSITQIGGEALERAILSEQAQQMATMQERQRIARELHDAVNQVLFASTLFADSLPSSWERDPQAGKAAARKIVTLNRAAMAEMRKLLLELRPEAIARTSIPKLLQHLALAMQGLDEIDAELDFDPEAELILPPDPHVALYRIAQEAVTNVVKHSGATQARISLKNGASLLLEISDNGRGFDMARATMGMGMNSMRERAERIGATIDVVSAPGDGTRIIVMVPH